MAAEFLRMVQEKPYLLDRRNEPLLRGKWLRVFLRQNLLLWLLLFMLTLGSCAMLLVFVRTGNDWVMWGILRWDGLEVQGTVVQVERRVSSGPRRTESCWLTYRYRHRDDPELPSISTEQQITSSTHDLLLPRKNIQIIHSQHWPSVSVYREDDTYGQLGRGLFCCWGIPCLFCWGLAALFSWIAWGQCCLYGRGKVLQGTVTSVHPLPSASGSRSGVSCSIACSDGTVVEASLKQKMGYGLETHSPGQGDRLAVLFLDPIHFKVL